jgi:hypothetical protein
MKFFFNILSIIVSVAFLFLCSCSTDDRFSGSPVGNLEIVTLQGIISSPYTQADSIALPGQDFDFTAKLPEGVTFTDTVEVEVTTLRSDGRRTRKIFDILPGQTSVTDKIGAAGGLIYDTSMEMFISAINLQTVDAGKHYLIESNKLVIKTGNTSVPAAESDRLKVIFTWPNPRTQNKIGFFIDRPNPPGIVDSVNSQFNSDANGKPYTILNSGGTASKIQSSDNGEYIFSIGGGEGCTLLQEPIDMAYRFVIVFPDGKVKVIQGTYFGLTENILNSPLIPIFKINKEILAGGEYKYTYTKL